MSEDKFDAIVVGGGIAGCVTGYLLAKAGLETLIIERGNFPGSKNMTGGRLYGYIFEEIFPGFAESAPIERSIVHEKISYMDEDSSVTADYAAPESSDPKNRSYSVLRAEFDQWLGNMAEEAGAAFVPGIRVDDILTKDGKVCGVVAGGEEMFADVVVLADGANSILGEKLGMVSKVTPENCAVGAKELIKLSEEKINDRFACRSNEGAAWLFAGMPSDGQMGGGFLYTNKESISLGVVVGLHDIEHSGKSVSQMLDDFKNHPTIAPLIADGELLEYSARLVPEGGYGMLPKLVDDGVVLVGNAAGFCLNLGYTICGMDLAAISAREAAEAIIAAKEKGDFSAGSLSAYEKGLEDSFVMKSLKLYKNAPALLSNSRMYNEYPEMAIGAMKEMYTINGTDVRLMRKKLKPHLKKTGLINILKDGWRGLKSI